MWKLCVMQLCRLIATLTQEKVTGKVRVLLEKGGGGERRTGRPDVVWGSIQGCVDCARFGDAGSSPPSRRRRWPARCILGQGG